MSDVWFDLSQARAVIQMDDELRQMMVAAGAQRAGMLLDQRAGDGLTPTQYWKQLGLEFRKLICSDAEDEYADLRAKAKRAREAGELIGLPLLSAALAKSVNLPVGLVSPFVALLMLTAADVGVRAWCASTDLSGKT